MKILLLLSTKTWEIRDGIPAHSLRWLMWNVKISFIPQQKNKVFTTLLNDNSPSWFHKDSHKRLSNRINLVNLMKAFWSLSSWSFFMRKPASGFQILLRVRWNKIIRSRYRHVLVSWIPQLPWYFVKVLCKWYLSVNFVVWIKDSMEVLSHASGIGPPSHIHQ